MILKGTLVSGGIQSKTATRLIREWIDLHEDELLEDWELAKRGKELKKIDPLE